MSDLPKFSVIIPCYNQSKFIYESIVSARHAYSGPLEIIVVNDGSTEGGTIRRLEQARDTLATERCEIKIINQLNSGLPATRNAGLANSTGMYVQFLDCDDLLIAGKLDLHLQHFRVVEDLQVSISGCLYANLYLDRFETHEDTIASFDLTIDNFCFSWERGFSIPIHTAVFLKTLLDLHQFDPSLRSKEDWEFWARITHAGAKAAYLRTKGAVYRIHDASICRAMPAQGEHWLQAARKINTLVSDSLPEFMNKAEEWKSNYYDNLPPPPPTKIVSSPQIQPPIRQSLILPSARKAQRDNVRLSVVVPVHNHFEYLHDCFQSIFDQDFQEDFEIIIIDDHSTDSAVRSLLESLPSHPYLKVLYNSHNCGISVTQNKAVEQAQGEYIAFVDCDDFLPRDALARGMACIEEHGGCDYFFSDHTEVPVGGGPARLVHYGGYSDQRFVGDLRQDLVNGMVAGHLKIIRRESLLTAGGFDLKFSGVQDWELALKILESGTFAYLPQSLYFRRTHAETVTTSDMRGQVHLTNVVRRLYADRLLQPERNTNPSVLLSSEKLFTLDVLSRWKSQPLVIDTTKGITLDNLWWLREFNSYFDEIFWSAPEVYAALIGYVWSPNILTRV